MEDLWNWVPEQHEDGEWEAAAALPTIDRASRRLKPEEIRQRIGDCYRAVATIRLSIKAAEEVEARLRAPGFFRLSEDMVLRCQREMRWLQSLL